MHMRNGHVVGLGVAVAELDNACKEPEDTGYRHKGPARLEPEPNCFLCPYRDCKMDYRDQCPFMKPDTYIKPVKRKYKDNANAKAARAYYEANKERILATRKERRDNKKGETRNVQL